MANLFTTTALASGTVGKDTVAAAVFRGEVENLDQYLDRKHPGIFRRARGKVCGPVQTASGYIQICDPIPLNILNAQLESLWMDEANDIPHAAWNDMHIYGTGFTKTSWDIGQGDETKIHIHRLDPVPFPDDEIELYADGAIRRRTLTRAEVSGD